jgi:RNA polymerase sigma-70 factor (ECF subfamily)
MGWSTSDAAADEMAGWLRDACAGSQEAIGKVLAAHQRYLLGIANRQVPRDLRSKGGGSDLVQETLLEAHRDFTSFRGRTDGEFRAWLGQILVSNARNFIRRYRDRAKRQIAREVPIEIARPLGVLRPAMMAAASSPSSQLIRKEEGQALDHALVSLPEPYRRVISLRYREGRPFEEIARRTGRSLEATRKIWYRGIALLSRELEDRP